MKDYKDSLHLPETSFPMRADLAKREPDFLKAWQTQKVYQQVQAARQDAPSFILHDGPPYANGTLHVGHAANKILKDIVVKSKVLQGYRAPYVPGWDCHGLPIELVVEKKWGKPGQKLSVAEFRQKCREYAAEQIDLQREDFKRLGILGEWDQPYITMDHAYEAEQIRVLARIYEQGRIKKGYKPVHWCLDCASSLAEAEVEYQDKTSDSITVKFSSPEGYVLIWTTTPWTLPANQAVSAGPAIIYVKVRFNGELYLLAEALLESVFAGETVEIVATLTGKELEGLRLQHPFENRQVPIILGEHVTTDAGTGFVHTAPAHGVDDFNVSKKYGIDVLNPVGSNGCYTAGTPFFEGTHVTKANPLVIAKLQENGALFKHEKINHSFPHCWRHKTPLIFRATPQWFISMEGLNQQAVAAVEAVGFTPSEGRNRFLSMLKDRPDWCISRQRTWGVPIPFFIHRESGALHPQTASLLEKVADQIAKNGLEAWFGAVPEDFGVKGSEYEKVVDTLDVWFDSGASNQCVLKTRPDLRFPADLYLEGSDQHRGWFQTSLLVSMAASQEAPYRHILTHGFLVDGEGRKMSKSIGNIVPIQEAANQYGADIIRLWVAMTDFTGEMAYSTGIMQQSADLYRKIRNTFRYLLGALADFSLDQALPLAELIEIDQFMLAKAFALKPLENYAIRDFMAQLHEFCEEDLSNVYFDVLKDRLYTENDLNRRSAQTALWAILNVIVRLVSPVLSFTADEVWQLMREKKWASTMDATIFTTQLFPSMPLAIDQEAWQKVWPQLKQVRAELNKILDEMRKNQGLGGNLQAEVVYPIALDNSLLQKISASGELKYFLISSSFQVGSEAKVRIATTPKCSRCWHHSETVHVRPDLIDDPSQQICERCDQNLRGKGIRRRYF